MMIPSNGKIGYLHSANLTFFAMTWASSMSFMVAVCALFGIDVVGRLALIVVATVVFSLGVSIIFFVGFSYGPSIRSSGLTRRFFYAWSMFLVLVLLIVNLGGGAAVLEAKSWAKYKSRDYVAAYQTIASYEGERPSSMQNIQALCLMHMNRLDEAINLLKPIAAEDGLYRANLAYAYALKNDEAAAWKLIGELGENDGLYTLARVTMIAGLLEERRNNFDAAQLSLAASMNLRSDFPDVIEARIALCDKVGKKAEAKSLSRDLDLLAASSQTEFSNLCNLNLLLGACTVPFGLLTSVLLFQDARSRKLNRKATDLQLHPASWLLNCKVDLPENLETAFDLCLASSADLDGFLVTRIDEPCGAIDISDGAGARTLLLRVNEGATGTSTCSIFSTGSGEQAAQAIKKRLSQYQHQSTLS